MEHGLYQFVVEKGDVVRLPSGDIGVVAKYEILCAGHSLRVVVVPFVGMFKRLFWSLLNSYVFYDSDVNSLKRVGSLAG